MTQRERRLMVVLLAILGVGTAYAVVKFAFLDRYLRLNREIEQAEEEVDRKESQLNALRADVFLLQEGRKKSLPAPAHQAAQAYTAYLKPLLEKAGLKVEDFAPAGLDARSGTTLGGKKTNHRILTFTVRAKGPLKTVLTALENMQKTPVLHRVKNLTLDRSESAKDDRIGVQMTVEALLMGDVPADHKLVMKPVEKTVPAAVNPRREYAQASLRNPFLGYQPPPPPPPPVVKKEEPEEPEDTGPDIRPYVRLVSTDPTNQEAYLRNLLVKTGEVRLKGIPMSGYDSFRIRNLDGSSVVVRGKVLRVDQRDVYIQVGEDVFALHIGESLAEAMRRPLSTQELRDLGLLAMVDGTERAGPKEKSK